MEYMKLTVTKFAPPGCFKCSIIWLFKYLQWNPESVKLGILLACG